MQRRKLGSKPLAVAAVLAAPMVRPAEQPTTAKARRLARLPEPALTSLPAATARPVPMGSPMATVARMLPTKAMRTPLQTPLAAATPKPKAMRPLPPAQRQRPATERSQPEIQALPARHHMPTSTFQPVRVLLRAMATATATATVMETATATVMETATATATVMETATATVMETAMVTVTAIPAAKSRPPFRSSRPTAAPRTRRLRWTLTKEISGKSTR